MKRIAVTGPTGAIGIALLQKCICSGTEVYAFCRQGSDRVKRIPVHELVHIIECSLHELKNFDENKIPPCDVFYHLGWEATSGTGRDDMQLQLKNIQYTLDAVALAGRLGCHCFIGAGSQAEYGRHTEALQAKTAAFPENGYGMAKLCAGQMSRTECERIGIKHIWARILSVYGPYDGMGTMICSTISRLLAKEQPLFTPSRQEWDYLYSADAANALFLLGEKGKNNKIYCLGSGKARPLIEYIETIRDAIDPGAELGIGALPYGKRQVMHLCADIRELTEDTGFLPGVSFEEGIRKTIAWVRREKGLSQEEGAE